MTSYAKLKPIIEPSNRRLSRTKLNRSVKDLAAAIGSGREVGRLALSIKDGSRRHSYAIELAGGKHTVATDHEGRSDLELSCDEAVFRQMLAGTLSPADAFLSGRLNVRGNLGFAKRIYARAASGRLGDLGSLGE